MGIKSDNAKSIFHGRVMQMGAHSQDFPREAGCSLHWEGALWNGTRHSEVEVGQAVPLATELHISTPRDDV